MYSISACNEHEVAALKMVPIHTIETQCNTYIEPYCLYPEQLLRNKEQTHETNRIKGFGQQPLIDEPILTHNIMIRSQSLVKKSMFLLCCGKQSQLTTSLAGGGFDVNLNSMYYWFPASGFKR